MNAEIRIGDAEREAAVGALGEHYAAGRLSKAEFDERAELAWSARTESALRPLFADLPAPGVGAPVAVPTPPWPAPAGRVLPRSAPPRPPRPRRPWPMLLVLGVVAMVLTAAPWPALLVLVGLWWFSRSRTGCRG